MMKRLALKPHAIDRARELRRNSTPAESIIWRALRENMPNEKWRRQVPIGPYFADFVSHRAKLIIELDGSQHADAIEADAARTSFLKSQGYRVLRFWNNEVMRNLDGVLTVIAAALPSPLVGEGGAKRRMRGPAADAAAQDAADVAAQEEPLTPCPLPQGEREIQTKSQILES
jgi:very-short-patch-repair endonuclease